MFNIHEASTTSKSSSCIEAKWQLDILFHLDDSNKYFDPISINGSEEIGTLQKKGRVILQVGYFWLLFTVA